MARFHFLHQLKKAFRKILHLLAGPAKVDSGKGGLVIQTYRGFGSHEEIFFMGRVFHQSGHSPRDRGRPLPRDMINLLRRLVRRRVPHARLEVRFKGVKECITTDRRGYFKVQLRYDAKDLCERLWHPVFLTLTHPSGRAVQTEGTIFIPPPTARFVVISDIDDTVVLTGVANKLMMIWRLFMQKARSRTAFPGVAAFYRALHYSSSGSDINPMLYVSRGPWSIYEVLDEFFNSHHIPAGPILFLRDWGIEFYRPFPSLAKGHKLALIERMLGLYRDLPFILIGDSGQRDAEIYTQIVQRHPGRVLSVYIRDIGKKPERQRVIEALTREVGKAGSTLVLASDTFEMAVHAAKHDFISEEALGEILQEQRKEKDMNSSSFSASSKKK